MLHFSRGHLYATLAPSPVHHPRLSSNLLNTSPSPSANLHPHIPQLHASPLQANEFLLLNQKLTAQEAFERNLVTRVFPASEFDSKVEELLKYMAQLPPQVQQAVCVFTPLWFMSSCIGKN